MNRKILLLVALIAVFVGYAAWSFSSSVTPYVGIAQAKASTSNVQVKGLQDKSVPAQMQDGNFTFGLVDEETGETMKVRYHGTKPDQFDEAHHIVAIGQYKGDAFEANKLLIKCPSKYEQQK